jgi:hypothetical protein
MTEHDFIATVYVKRNGEECTHLNLKYALEELVRRACASSPDRRFDWQSVQINVEPISPAPS